MIVKSTSRFAAVAVASWLIAANAQAVEVGVATQLLQELQEQIEAQETFDKAGPVPEKLHFSPSGTVVEFYNQDLRHYFRTADPAEVTAILNGAAGPGWIRTNDDFPTWTTGGLYPTSALPVCRFYAPGPNSHFFTSDAGECAFVKLDPGWHYEGIAYYVAAKNAAGACSSDYAPIYRVYNNRFAVNDSNHRFTTSQLVYQQMIAQGWAGEGIVMCVPTPTTTQQQKSEQLIGGTWVIPYRYGLTNYIDRLTYTGLTVSATTGEIYATGTSGHNNALTLGQYAPTLGKWAMMAPYSNSFTYPNDFYVVTITGNTLSGCYYFLLSSSTPTTNCTAITGTRQ